MARCYSGCVRNRHPPRLPRIWLISDARIDGRIEAAMDRLPRGSGFVFRHYHLSAPDRCARFLALMRRARRRGHLVALSGTPTQARRLRAQGAYGAPLRLSAGPDLLRLATVHSLRELAMAHRVGCDAVFISPVFMTRTHAAATPLGPVRFRLLAARARIPVIALGGMSPAAAHRAGAERWAAIESLAQPRKPPFPIHS